ncbi:MAG: hypothetical protein HQ567_04455 [Candidatus Nealsonbacteria bacterium]|nr:hypothetical protein [Candidatus Nealsonbacteria bacterium]
MRLCRELGTMQLDPEGRWIEYPIGGPEQDAPDYNAPGLEELPLPPAIPPGWVEPAK